MILRRLFLERYRRFQELEIGLGPGLNVIKGPNEAGKSTVHTAIQACLFDSARSTAKSLHDALNWQSDRMYKLGLELEVEDEVYLLERNFEDRTQSLSGEPFPAPLTDAKEIEARLTDWLGCPTKAFFSWTACVAHDELPEVSEGHRELSDRLQAAVTGGEDVSSSAAIRKLESHLRDLCVGLNAPAKTAGPIRQLMDELNRVRRRHSELSLELQALDEDKQRLAYMSGEMGRLEEEIARQGEMLQANSRAVDLKDEINRLMDRYRQFRLASDRYKRMRTATLEMEQLSAFARAESDLSQAEGLTAGLRVQERLLEEQEQRHSSLRRQPLRAAPFLLGAGLLLALAGITAGVLANPYLALTALLGLGLGMYSALLMRDYLMARALEGEVAAQRRAVDDVRQRLDQLMQKYGLSSPEEIYGGRERYQKASATLSAVKTELASVLGISRDSPPGEWASQWKRFEARHANLALEIQQRRDALLQLSSSLLQPIRAYVFDEEPATLSGHRSDPASILADLKADLNRLVQMRDDMRYEMAGVAQAIERSKLDPEEIAHLEELAEDLQQKLDTLLRRKRAAELAIEGIKQAHLETMASATKALEADIGRQIERMTGGRYQQVAIDESSLAMTVISPEKGELVPLCALSRATIDQFYLAARLGLMKLVLNGRQPPLLLDDPFVTFDGERTKKAMGLLKEVSKEYQVLFFTCADEYDGFADHVITLPPPDAPQSPT